MLPEDGEMGYILEDDSKDCDVEVAVGRTTFTDIVNKVKVARDELFDFFKSKDDFSTTDVEAIISALDRINSAVKLLDEI